MSMYMTDTFCSFTRNFIFKSCILLSEYGIMVDQYVLSEGNDKILIKMLSFPTENDMDEAPYYTHLGAAGSLPDCRQLIEKR